MAGIKGRSGRRTNKANEQINILAGMSIQWGIDHWGQFSTEQRLKILLSLAPKYVTQNLSVEGGAGNPLKIAIVDFSTLTVDDKK